jgi:hypothetical protein
MSQRASLATSTPGDRNGRLLIVFGIFGVALLFALAALVHVPLIYDEAPYLKPVALLDQYGFSIKFLMEYPEPAGLLHNVIHWFLAPLTGLQPPLVRLVNPILLVFTIALTALTLKTIKASDPMASGLTFVGIPFTWVITGMALTELPAILLISLSIYLLVIAKQRMAAHLNLALVIALLGGASLGLAFLSRAMVLVVLGALPCLLIDDWRRSLPIVIAFAAGSVVIVGPIVVLWQGLVPPHSAVPVAATTFSVYHLAFSFAYAAVVMLILAPRWFALDLRIGTAIFAVILAVNALMGVVEISVMKSLVAQLPATVAAVAPRVCGSIMIALATLFVLSSVKNLYVHRSDAMWTFFAVSMLLLIASAGKIVHQYSSRYTAMASGLMILASSPYATLGGSRVVRIVSGMLVGLASLLSYYFLSQ